MLLPDELQQIRARCDAADPGPYTVTDDRHEKRIVGPDGQSVLFGEPTHEGNHDLCGRDETLTFVAAARADVPRLLDEIDRLKALLVLMGTV